MNKRIQSQASLCDQLEELSRHIGGKIDGVKGANATIEDYLTCPKSFAILERVAINLGLYDAHDYLLMKLSTLVKK